MPRPTRHALDDDAELRQAHQQFKLIVDAESDLRQRMLEDYRFVDQDGGQWEAALKRARENDGRPCLQIDRTSGQVRQIVNRIVQQRPGIQVTPVDNGADLEKAEIRQGVIRYLEDESDVESVEATAVEHQVKFGLGYWRIVPEYIQDEADDPTRLFRQEPRIRAVDNPFGIYCDPVAMLNPLKMRFAFVPEDLDPDEYAARFGDEGPPQSGLDTLRATGDAAPDWFPAGKIRIAEYFSVMTTYETVRVGDGDGAKSRRIQRRQVRWKLLNALKVLDRRDIPGPYIPIVPVIGERTNIDGVIDLKGVVRRAKDPQRMVNYGRSKTVETVALAPSAPFVAAVGQTESYQAQWDSANRRNWSVLLYDPKDVAGTALPAPQRNFGEPPIQALVGMSREFEQDLRSSMQMPDVQGQERRPEQSGTAIRYRELQSETGNAHFAAHYRQAKVLTGRILNAWIPVYFDVPTQLQIVGKDGKPQDVIVHAGQAEAAQQVQQTAIAPGGAAVHPPPIVDLQTGRFDIRVSAGPSFQSQRQENRDQLGSLLEKNPQLLPLLGDLFFENWDDPIGQQIAKRLRQANPALADEAQGQPPIPPAVQQKMQALLQQHEQLTRTVDALVQQRESKQLELQAQAAVKKQELAAQREEAQAEAALALEKARIAAETDLQIARMKVDMERQIAQMRLMVSTAMPTMSAGQAEGSS